MHSLRRSLQQSVAVLMLLGQLPPAAAQEPSPTSQQPRPPDEDARMLQELGPIHSRSDSEARTIAQLRANSPPAFVVSGGISLGAYQAGLISTLSRFWGVAGREAGTDYAPRVWTGASAGAVNALMGGIAGCDPEFQQPTWTPEGSLFWKVWVEKLDLDQLAPWEDDGRTDHLFSAAHMDDTIATIGKALESRPLRPNCTFAFGLTTTNLAGRDVLLGTGGPDAQAPLKRVTERFVVQVSTDASGKLAARLPVLAGADASLDPSIRVRPDEFRYYPALGSQRPTGVGGQAVELKHVLRNTQASGAFPLAFPPVELEASFFDETNGVWADPRKLRVMDGGFLNNNPLDLAERLGRRWRDAAPAAAVPQPADPSVRFHPEQFLIVYLDQDIVDWVRPVVHKPESRSPLVNTLVRPAPSLMAAARDGVVLDMLENDVELAKRIKVPRRRFVLPSEFRYAMMGFFDRRFREHDFYRGIEDAIHFLASQLESTHPMQRLVPPLEGEDLSQREARIRKLLGLTSAGYECVAGGSCGEQHRDLGKLREATAALTCRAKAGQLADDAVDLLLAELGKQKYHYGEGVMGGTEATGTRNDLMPVRARLGRAYHDMVSEQSGSLAFALRPVGAVMLDEWLTYTPPRWALTLHLGRHRGVSVGAERPFVAFERRGDDDSHHRSELRFGGAASILGTRHADQLLVNETRRRPVAVSAYVDAVTDAPKVGPYMRARVGLGASASLLGGPREIVYEVPEVRLGLDVTEVLGVRLTLPTFTARRQRGGHYETGVARVFADAGFGVEFLWTHW